MSTQGCKIKVCHLASGDLWAGAEVQVVNSCRGLLDTGAVDVTAVVLNEGRLAKELQSLGLKVFVLDEQTSTWWQILWQLRRHLHRRPVDLLHTHRYKENILGSTAAKMSGVAHIHTPLPFRNRDARRQQIPLRELYRPVHPTSAPN